MPGAHRFTQFGPDTYEVSAPVTGGQLVEPDGTTGKVKPASANTLHCLGVALTDAEPVGTNPTSPLNISWAQPQVAVGYGPGTYDLVFAGAVNFGQLVVAANNGQVDLAPDDASGYTIVGRCVQPGNVAAGGVGRVRLFI
jgi:hypothetical protein